MHASFWTIYKRARFTPRGLSEKERMEQRERFGAACLALCFQHDEAFCADFVGTICGMKSLRGRWRVDVDPWQGWADILLRQGKCAIVVECKIGDDLMPKQDPWHHKDDFMAEKRGYGWYLQREFPDSDRRYLVLSATKKETEKTISGTVCRTITWTDVYRLRKTSGKWIRDLFLSLANLDYPAFRFMKTKNLRLLDVEASLCCHEVLESVANRLGLADWKIQHSAAIEEEGGIITDGSIGIEIVGFKRSQRAQSKIRKTINSPLKYKAWFGYDLVNRSPGKPMPSLSVWFYCGSVVAVRRVKECVRGIKGWKVVPPGKDRKNSEKHFLQYSRATGVEKSDSEQFLAVLSPVIPEIVGT